MNDENKLVNQYLRFALLPRELVIISLERIELIAKQMKRYIKESPNMKTEQKTENELGMMNLETGEISTNERSQSAMTEIQSVMIIAKKFPRNESTVFSRLLESSKRFTFAKKAQYFFRRGGKQISGPSVVLAREGARLWGNMRWGLDIIRDDEESRTIEGWAWDLETNVKVTAQDDFKKLIQRKNYETRKTDWVIPDERDLRELTNRRGAILVRNCLLQLIPKDIIEQAQAQCDKTLLGNIGKGGDKRATIGGIIKGLEAMDVSIQMIQDWAEVDDAFKMSNGQVVDLIKIGESLRDGHTKTHEHFGKKKKTSDKKKEEKPKNEGELKPEEMEAGKPEEQKEGHDLFD